MCPDRDARDTAAARDDDAFALSLVGRLPFKGFPARSPDRTDHLSQVPGCRRTGRIASDWAVDPVFRRDVAELGTLGHPHALER